MLQPAPDGQSDASPEDLVSGWQWPAFVIVLLATSVLMMMGVLYVASRNGGAQVIDNYYQKAVGWDVQQAEQARSDALGWAATLEVDEGWSLSCFIRDRSGQIVQDLDVTFVAFRPQFADAQAELVLVLDPETGAYEAILPAPRHGLWDFEIRATRGTDVFITIIRKTL